MYMTAGYLVEVERFLLEEFVRQRILAPIWHGQ